jgi:Uma2 family endonuclease
MKVVMLEAPQAMLDERRRLGLDVRDEMWDGVLHVVPPPGGSHQRLNTRMIMFVGPVAERRRLVPHSEAGLFSAADNYSVPDQLYCRPEHLSDRGAERAEVVVEVRSPGDETYEKIDFYASLGVQEMLIIHPKERRVELLRPVGGQLIAAQPAPDGELESKVLGVTLRTVDDKLRITWDGGTADI